MSETPAQDYLLSKVRELKAWHEEHKPGEGSEDEFREMVINILENVVLFRSLK